MATAAGVTFYAILAIFPAVAALVSLYGLFADAGKIAAHLDQLSGFLPGGAVDVLRDQMTRVASKPPSTLGLTFFASLLIALWSANAGMKALFDALNVVYEEEEKRSFLRLNIVSLTFTAGGILFFLAATTAVVVLPLVVDFAGFGGTTKTLIEIARWPALLVVITLALACIYRYGPSREKPRWRWITWGSASAAIGWLLASFLFSWYAANFGSYNETYGSLGAVVGFMIWIWISTTVILVGADLDAEMEHQTARDTTVGRPKPMGARGAVMADTVGSAQG
ncbi:MAG: ribonuclease [Rhodospirillales bacterium]|nr:ribonuclease [Rhodospirillales bacterium]